MTACRTFWLGSMGTQQPSTDAGVSIDRSRRHVLMFGAVATGGIAMEISRPHAAGNVAQTAVPPRATSSRRLEPLRSVDAGALHISYYETGPAEGPAVVLLHGFPYDIHSYVDVAPQLAAQS